MMTTSLNLVNVFQLKDKPDVLKHLQEFVREQTRELFDVNHTYREQKPEIRLELLHKVCQRFPRLFENDETKSNRIRAVNQYVKRFYGSSRVRSFVSAPRETASIKRPLNREKAKSSRPPPLEARATDTYVNIPRKAIRGGRESNTITSYFDSIDTSKSGRRTSPILIDPSPSPQTSVSNVIAATSSSQQEITHPIINGPKYRINEVRNFLSMCIPDMQHLLGAFLDYGIRNREILFVIAVQWSDEELGKLLKGVFQRAAAPADGGGAYDSVPEMDILILKKHFKRSFIGEGS